MGRSERRLKKELTREETLLRGGKTNVCASNGVAFGNLGDEYIHRTRVFLALARGLGRGGRDSTIVAPPCGVRDSSSPEIFILWSVFFVRGRGGGYGCSAIRGLDLQLAGKKNFYATEAGALGALSVLNTKR